MNSLNETGNKKYIDIQKIQTHKNKVIKFDINLFEKISGLKIPNKKK